MGWLTSKTKIYGKTTCNLRNADDTSLAVESEEELKSLLTKVKKESEKAAWKLNIQKIKITASSPIILQQIEGRKEERDLDFIFLGSKITVDVDCNHEIQRSLLLEMKAMTNLDIILKSRDIILPAKVHLVKAMVLPVVMYWMWKLDYKESWAPKNWCFWTVVLEKTLEGPLNCKEFKPVNLKSNQLLIFIFGRTDAETPILWSLDAKCWLTGKDPNVGKMRTGGDKGDRGWDDWMASLTQWTWDWANSGRQRTGKHFMLQFMGWQRSGQDTTEQQHSSRFLLGSRLDVIKIFNIKQ